jgi:glycosyltransferase involved in cell wall biosynthesis
MRVVQVNCARDPLRRFGTDLLDAWPTLGSVAAAVRNAGVDVTVVQSSHRDGTCEREGVTFDFVAEPWPGGPLGAACFPMRLASAVRGLAPDVVHVNGLGFPFHTRALSAFAPVLVQDHADNPDSHARVLRRWGLAKISGVAFTAEEQALPFFENRTLCRRTQVFQIPESSTRFTDGDRRAASNATGVFGRPAVLWVGHMDENKDPLTIIDGFSRALPDIPEAHLWCCYRNAPLLDRVRARIAQNSRLAGHLHLLGSVPHETVELLCRAADLFILGSRRESCGYALIEALACGATPIVSDIPAFRAITSGGTVGVLCKPGHAAAFAAALVSLARLPSEALRARAISYFQSDLSFSVVGRKLATAYESIVARHVDCPTGQ